MHPDIEAWINAGATIEDRTERARMVAIDPDEFHPLEFLDDAMAHVERSYDAHTEIEGLGLDDDPREHVAATAMGVFFEEVRYVQHIKRLLEANR